MCVCVEGGKEEVVKKGEKLGGERMRQKRGLTGERRGVADIEDQLTMFTTCVFVSSQFTHIDSHLTISSLSPQQPHPRDSSKSTWFFKKHNHKQR